MGSGKALRPVLAAAAFVIGIDAVIVSGLLPGIISSLAISSTEAGQLITIFGVGYAVLAPLLARPASAHPPRTVLVGALLLFAAANAMAALAPGYPLLLLARLLASAGAALYTPTALALASQRAPAGRRGHSIAVVLSGATAAAVLGVPAGLLLAAALSWRATFAVIAGCAAAACWALAAVVPAARLQPAKAPGITAVLACRQARRIATVTLLAYLGEFTVYSYLGIALTRIAGISARELPFYYMLFGAAGVAGNLAGGRSTDRWPARHIANLAMALLAVALITFPVLLPDRRAIAASVISCGFSAWLLSVPQQRRLLAVRPDAATILLGLNQSALYLGLSLSGVTGALLLRIIGLRDLGYAAAVIVLIAAALSLRQRAQGSGLAWRQGTTAGRHIPHSGPGPGAGGDVW